MGTTLALEHLFDGVQAQFLADGSTVKHFFGWKEPPRQREESSRIIWTPGDASQSVGAVGPARFPGRNPRPLATLHELVTVRIIGYDSTAPLDERLQWKATRLLFDAWYRAAYIVAHGTFTIASSQWLTGVGAQHRHGAALQVVCVIDSMIPDAVEGTAPTDTAAHITPSIDTTSDVVMIITPE